MAFGIKEFIETALSVVNARLGTILLLGGAAVVGLHWLEIGPSNLLEKPVIAAAWISFIFGSVVVFVDGSRFVGAKALEWRQRSTEASTALAAARHLDREATENLEALTNLELRQLVWIIRNGRQRIASPNVDGLVAKHILRSPQPYTPYVYLVADPIWAMRDELLERHKQLARDRDLPHVSPWA